MGTPTHNPSRGTLAALMVAAVLMATFPAGADDGTKKPYRLARDAGCMVCHDVESPLPGSESTVPLAPSFEDIARRYHNDPQAADTLSSIVHDGTGPLRRDRHWEGKARFDSMYPNDFELTQEEARAIVDWILTLAPAKSSDRHTTKH